MNALFFILMTWVMSFLFAECLNQYHNGSAPNQEGIGHYPRSHAKSYQHCKMRGALTATIGMSLTWLFVVAASGPQDGWMGQGFAMVVYGSIITMITGAFLGIPDPNSPKGRYITEEGISLRQQREAIG